MSKLFHVGWFSLEWWKYLYGECSDPEDSFEFLLRLQRGLWRTKVAWCRATGHRSVYWYNPSGFEPDQHCENCGDDLG